MVERSDDAQARRRGGRNRKAAAETGRPVSANTYARTLMNGLFGKADLGVFVTHVPLEFGGGDVGVIDVLYFPRREETVIDTTRLPMATLAVTAIGLSILMMNIALTGVLRLIDDLRSGRRPGGRRPARREAARVRHARDRRPRALGERPDTAAETTLGGPDAIRRGREPRARDAGRGHPRLHQHPARVGAWTTPRCARRPLGAIDRESRRMVRLTGELLSLVRSGGAAPAEVVRESVDVNALIRDVMASTATRYIDKGVEFEGPDDEIRFYAWTDPDRLEQVLAILLDNAAKYTPAAGRVWAQAGVEREDVVVKVARHRPGDPRGPAPAHLRALLPRGRLPREPGGGLRARPGHREASDRDDRRGDRRPERGRRRHDVQHPAARRGGLTHGAGRGRGAALLGGALRRRGRPHRGRLRGGVASPPSRSRASSPSGSSSSGSREALTVVALFTPAAIPGLWLGTVVANATTGRSARRGSTCSSAGSARCSARGGRGASGRGGRCALLGPVMFNALIVPAYLPILLKAMGLLDLYRLPLLGWDLSASWPLAYVFGVVSVGIGQAVVVYGLGWPLATALERSGITRSW